MNKGQIW